MDRIEKLNDEVKPLVKVVAAAIMGGQFDKLNVAETLYIALARWDEIEASLTEVVTEVDNV